MPQSATTTYGKGNVRLAQADVSHLKAIKAALLDPPAKPDLEALAGALAAAGLVAYKILHPGQEWVMPATGYELLVLVAVLLNAYQAVAKCIKAYKVSTTTRIALAQLNDMIVQIEPVTDGANVPEWWRFLSHGKRSPQPPAKPPQQMGPGTAS